MLSGRAQERGGGTSDGVRLGLHLRAGGSQARTVIALTATPAGTSASELAGLLGPQDVRRLTDGRHELFVRARDAAGNWGPVRPVVLPDRPRGALAARLGVAQAGGRLRRSSSVRDRGSGTTLLRYRVEVDGRIGGWRSLTPAAQIRLTLHVPPGHREILRVRAVDLVGNETRVGLRPAALSGSGCREKAADGVWWGLTPSGGV